MLSFFGAICFLHSAVAFHTQLAGDCSGKDSLGVTSLHFLRLISSLVGQSPHSIRHILTYFFSLQQYIEIVIFHIDNSLQ